MEYNRTRHTPAAHLAVKCVEGLVALQQEHRRSFDPKLKHKAVAALQTVPLLGVEDDPHFLLCIRTLRVAGYFGATHAPMVLSLLNHLTKHAFLLDGCNLYQICRVLTDLQHPQGQEVLLILLPRMRAVTQAGDVTALELAYVIRALHRYDLRDETFLQSAAAVMGRALPDMPLNEWVHCVAVLDKMPTETAKNVLRAGEARLCEHLEEAVLSHKMYSSQLSMTGTNPNGAGHDREASAHSPMDEQHMALWQQHAAESRALLVELTRILTYVQWGPRRVMNAYLRAVLTYTAGLPPTQTRQMVPGSGDSEESVVVFAEETQGLEALREGVPILHRDDMCYVMKALTHTKYRHERALRHLASRIAASREHNTNLREDEAQALSGLAIAVEALAFFDQATAAASLSALLEEILQRVVSSSALGPPMPILLPLASALESIVRLRLPAAATTAEGDGHHLEGFLHCRPLHQFAALSVLQREPLLTVRLLTAITQICVQLKEGPAPPPALMTPVAVRERSELLCGLLDGAAHNRMAQWRDTVRSVVDLTIKYPSCFDGSVLHPVVEKLSVQLRLAS